ncbi:hypothetical protein V7S43_012910 [Phytophthora oleae]|uniref:Uncharacterized protein n=1 Tax=Phytophthora oleae TaxID=2107226 RepID=A0ABD3F9B3_9STRA
MVELAGLSDQVTVNVGPFSEQYEVLCGKTVDVVLNSRVNCRLVLVLSLVSVFVDVLHRPRQEGISAGLEASETLTPGSVIIADNVGLGPTSGHKNEYVKFVENSSQFLKFVTRST